MMESTPTSSPYCISAFRKGAGWIKACAHQHPNVDDADKCAEKRGATVIVFDPEGIKASAIAPAPYISLRRERRRAVAAAETILRSKSPAMIYVVRRDDGTDLRFAGTVLGAATSQDQDQPASRWTDVTIYRTDTGKYVASVIGRTSLPGEVDRFKAFIAEDAEAIVTSLSHPTRRFLTIVAKQAIEAACELDSAFCEALVQDI